MQISPNKEAMLRALGRYKYLTPSHILKLGISKSKIKTATYFRELKKDYGFVGRQIHYGLAKSYSIGERLKRTRHEYLRHLTITGAKFLDSRTELSLPQICFPKRPNEYLSNDYFHRVSTIFMHLSFDKWMKETSSISSQFMSYYKQFKAAKSKRFEAETRLQFKDGKHYTPDAFCTYTTLNKQPYILALEVYNSRGNNRTKYVVKQMEKLLWIIDNTRKIEQRTGVNTIPRILCTLDSKPFLVDVLKRIRKHPFFRLVNIESLLFFNIDVNVWNCFYKSWVNIEGKQFNLDKIQQISQKN